MISKDQVVGIWRQVRGIVQEQWGKLTRDDRKQLEGHAEQIVGKLQALYGLGREQAEHQVRKFRKRMDWNEARPD